MQVDLIKNLPPEITFDIILRLPVKTICISKCVSKPWLSLLESPDFVNFHLSKSLPGVVVSQIVDTTKQYRYLVSMNDHSASFNFSFPKPHRLLGSANGLLFLVENSERPQNFYICNPVTRNFISVPCPRRNNSTVLPRLYEMGSFGFGVSRETGEFKLVKGINELIHSNDSRGYALHSECQLYTLGEEQWRSVAPGEPFSVAGSPPGLFLKGNLYWLTVDSEKCKSIRCFDLETESFSKLSPPSYGDRDSYLCIMEERLCYCCNSADGVIIWSMTEDEGVKSWTKKSFTVKPDRYVGSYSYFFPITVLKEGGILMGCRMKGVGILKRLWSYSNRSNFAEKTDLVLALDEAVPVIAVPYTPSFVSLRPFSRRSDLESF